MDFSVEIICLTDGNGKPVSPASRPVLVEHTSFSSLDEAVQDVVDRGGWELVCPAMMVDGHSAVVTVRRDKVVCSIHILPERRRSDVEVPMDARASD